MLRHSFICALSLISASFTAFAATETWTVGSNTWTVDVNTTELCPGVKYTLVNWQTIRSSNYPGSRLHVIEADLTNPKISVENVKVNAMTGNRTLVNHAKAVHKSDHQVVAGANGNFWITSPEAGNYACMGTQPHGICVSNGVMYTDPNVLNFAHCGGPATNTGLLVFDEKGKCYIDFTRPQLTNNEVGSGVQFAAINTRIGHRLMLDMCNRFVAYSCASIFTREYGTTKQFRVGNLYSDDWLPTTGSTGYIEIILDYADGVKAMNYGGLTDYVVKEIRYNPETVGSLGDHDLAIVGRDLFARVPYENWKVGDPVQLDTKINFSSMGSPEKIVNAISGNVLAMKNGLLTSMVTAEAYNKSINARTVYGTNADGTKLWMITCEHNVAQSKKYYGFSLEQICIMAREHFGVQNATQVDCGGSAQMYANGKQVAQSYDGSGARAVYNGLYVFYNGTDVKLTAPGADDPEPVDPDEGWKDSGERAHFAYGLTTMAGESMPTVRYSLTGAVKSADVVLTNRADASDVVTIAGTTSEGVNTVVISDPRLTVGATYDWVVKVNSYPVSATSHFYHDAPAKLDARGGVGVVTDHESSAFGKVITSMGYAQGFGLYTPALEKEGVYHAGSSPWVASNRSSLFRMAMRDSRVAYACDFSDSGAGYWRFDPENPSAAPVNLIGGVNDGKGCFTMPGSTDCIGSGASGIGFQGTGENTRLWVFAEDWPTGNSDYKGILSRWDIGTTDQITTKVNAAYDQYTGKKLMVNQNVSITGTPDGVFVSQVRGPGNNTTTAPGFIYTDIYGTLLYNSGNNRTLFNSCGGSVALSADRTLFAVAGNTENIKLYTVKWNDNVPEFTYLTDVNGTSHCSEVSQLAFDPAGNLYAWQRNTSADYAGLFGYSYKNANPVATTPAKASYAIVAADSSGIDSVTADEAEAVYYTVQGVRVDSDNLAPGLYIKVCGGKTEKVRVR